MPFRALQVLATATPFGMWLVKMLTHPGRLHPMLLVVTALVLVVSEASYRAGRHASAKERPL